MSIKFNHRTGLIESIGASGLQILDSTDTYSITIQDNGSLSTIGTNSHDLTLSAQGGLSNVRIDNGSNLHLRNAADLVIYDGSNVASMTFAHVGSDFDITGSSVTDINLTGVTAINAGTVGADFDALTATSYEGIAAAQLLGSATTHTLTNKTFDANGTGNSLSNVDVADLANGTDGELITWSAAGAPTTVAVGTATHVLTSNGPGTAPTFQAPAGGGTVSGTGTDNFIAVWNGTGDIDAVGSFNITNALDKSATETVSGAWTFTTAAHLVHGTYIDDSSGSAQLWYQDAAAGLRWRTGVSGEANDDFIIYDEDNTTVRFRIDDTSGDVSIIGATGITGALTATSFSGSGASLTSLTAANISAGNLATGVNSYFTASTAASNFKVPFMNYTGTASINAGLLHDDQSTFTYNPSTNTLSAGVFSGSGASLTSLTAANISSGNLGSGVLPYATASATSSAFKIPFLNTTGNSSGNYGLLHDSSNASPSYNPSTETFTTTIGSFTTVTATTIGGITATNLVDKSATETITGTWTLDGVVTTSDYGTGGRVKDGTDVSRPIGFNVMPVYEIDAADTFDLAHSGMLWHKDAGVAVTFTCSSAATDVPQGACWVVHNDDTENVTIAGSGATVYWTDGSGAPTAGSVTVEQGGIVTVYKYSDTEYWVWGAKTAAGGGGTPTDITVADESADTTCFPLFVTAATGDLGPKTGSNLTFNSSTGILGATTVHATGQMQAPSGFHGNYDDTAAATWGGPIWGMDDGFTGPTGGANALATSTYGIRWNRSSSTQASTYIGEGLYVYTNGVIEGGIGTSGTYSVGPVTASQVRSTGTLTLSTNTSENAIICTTNGQVSLYHDNGLEFRTQQHELGGNTSGAELYDHAGTLRDVGFNHVKEVAMTTGSITLSNLHAGTIIRRTGTSTVILTIEDAVTTEFPVGSMCTVLNHGTLGSLTISDDAGNLYIMDGSGTVTNSTGFVLAIGGCITLWRQATASYYVWGAGIP